MPASELRLPNQCTSSAVAATLVHAHEDVRFIVSPATFFYMDGLALLSAWAMHHCAAGYEVVFDGDAAHCRYLARMGVGAIATVAGRAYRALPAAGRFMPLSQIASRNDHEAVKRAVDGVCDLMVRNFDDSRSFLPAFEWAVQELVDNVVVHSETPTPAVVCGQVYPVQRRVDVGICDFGIGIRGSLASRFAFTSDREAIERAVERGVTRDPAVGQGNGLAGARLIAASNGGTLRLRSGGLELQFEAERSTAMQIPVLPGTGVCLRLRTDRPVDLADTWIAPRDWSYFNAEAERLVTQGGLVIRDECAHFGGRPPAELVRRKIESVIDDNVYAGTPLRIDFTGVSNPSSSFLDELIGKLVAKYGLETVKQRTRFVAAGSSIHAMLSVVVVQRLRERALAAHAAANG